MLVLVVIALAVAAYRDVRQVAGPRTPDGEARDTPLAPEFSVTDLSGHKINLNELRGKVVILDFWATWCEPCRKEVPQFVMLQGKYRGLQVIGISLDDSMEPVQEFYQEFKMNYPVVLGDTALAERYGGILGLPVTFVVDCVGRIRARHSGETDVSSIEAEFRPLLRLSDCTHP